MGDRIVIVEPFEPLRKSLHNFFSETMGDDVYVYRSGMDALQAVIFRMNRSFEWLFVDYDLRDISAKHLVRAIRNERTTGVKTIFFMTVLSGDDLSFVYRDAGILSEETGYPLKVIAKDRILEEIREVGFFAVS